MIKEAIFEEKMRKVEYQNLALQVGQVFVILTQGSMHSKWKMCPQPSFNTSFSSIIYKQTTQGVYFLISSYSWTISPTSYILAWPPI